MTSKLKLAWSYISDVLLSSVRRILTTVLFFVTSVCVVEVDAELYTIVWLVSLIMFIELWEDK